MKILFTLILIIGWALNISAQSREKAFDINEKLGRGINFGNMFEGPTETAWGNPWKPEYAGIIADLGFDHVRIPIRWEPASRSLSAAPYTLNATFLNKIRVVVDSALNNGLLAIINMHHHEELYENPDQQKDRFLKQWKQISEFFKDYPDSLVFEILNEPHGNMTPSKWNEFYQEALDTIRITNPDRIVLIGTAEYGGLGGLPALELPDDEFIILTVHYYSPFQFTHQGADWAGEEAQAWLGTKWLDTETDRNVIRQDFAPLKALEALENIPVHLGEFGAYSKADIDSRVRWTTFLSRYLEELGWSWAYWEFSAGFGIYNPSQKSILHPLTDALLHNEMPEAGHYAGTPIYTSDFSTGNNGWNLIAQQGASAQLVRSENTLTANIAVGGTQGWHVQMMRSNISLQEGKKYRFSFKAKADSTRSATVYIGMTRDPWSAYSGYNGINITDTTTTYTFVFDMASHDNAARMVFDLGNSNVNLTVSDIVIEEIVFQGPTETVNQMAFDAGIHPNPVNGQLFFNNNGTITGVDIFSVNGNQVISEKVHHTQNNIDVTGLLPGLYITHFSGKGDVAPAKFIKK